MARPSKKQTPKKPAAKKKATKKKAKYTAGKDKIWGKNESTSGYDMTFRGRSMRGKRLSKWERDFYGKMPKTEKEAKKKAKYELSRLKAMGVTRTRASKAQEKRLEAELTRLNTPKRTQPMTGGKAPPPPTRAKTPGRGRYEIAAQTIAPRAKATKPTKSKTGTGDKARRAVQRAASRKGPGARAPAGGTRGIPRKPTAKKPESGASRRARAWRTGEKSNLPSNIVEGVRRSPTGPTAGKPKTKKKATPPKPSSGPRRPGKAKRPTLVTRQRNRRRRRK